MLRLLPTIPRKPLKLWCCHTSTDGGPAWQTPNAKKNLPSFRHKSRSPCQLLLFGRTEPTVAMRRHLHSTLHKAQHMFFMSLMFLISLLLWTINGTVSQASWTICQSLSGDLRITKPWHNTSLHVLLHPLCVSLVSNISRLPLYDDKYSFSGLFYFMS